MLSEASHLAKYAARFLATLGMTMFNFPAPTRHFATPPKNSHVQGAFLIFFLFCGSVAGFPPSFNPK